jgi:hypothetical protein
MNTLSDRLPNLLACATPGMLEARLSGLGAALWTVGLADGATAQLEARLDAPWLVITERPKAAESAIPSDALWPALVQNAGAPPGWKTYLTPARSALFRNEILMGGDFNLEPRLPAIIAAFRAAKAGQTKLRPSPAGEAGPELESLCAESGWVATRRSSGRLTVTLRTGAHHQATVTPLDAGVRLWLAALDCGSLPPASRLAAAAIALQTTARLPLVRAAVDALPSQIGFEAAFDALPGPEELNAAFGALSAAAEATGEIFLALQDETLARDYLVIRGWSANVTQERSAEQ